MSAVAVISSSPVQSVTFDGSLHVTLHNNIGDWDGKTSFSQCFITAFMFQK